MAIANIIDRLKEGFYNSRPYHAVDNKGGLFVRHDLTFPAALKDVGDVAEYVGTQAGTVAAAQSTLSMLWDTGTADANPGVGKVRGSTAALTAGSYTLFVSTTDAAAGDASGILARYGASTSTIKGELRLVKVGDPTVYLDLDVTALAADVGYRKVSVTYVGGPGGFAAGDKVAMGFTRTGGKGDTGEPGTAATEAQAGIAKVATQAQVNTGTDDNAFVTALKLATRLAAVLTSYMTKAGGQFTGAVQAKAPVAVAYAAMVTLDLSAGNDFEVGPLTGNVTLANPTNVVAGQSGTITTVQDGTGGRTAAFGSFFKTSGGSAALTFTLTAGAVNSIDYRVRSATFIEISVRKDVK